MTSFGSKIAGPGKKKKITWDFFNLYRGLLNNFSKWSFENILSLILR